MQAYLELAKYPIGDLGYFLLALVIASFWVYRKIWIWGPLLIASLVLAYYGNIINYLALFPIGLLFFCHLAIWQDAKGFLRMFAAIIAIIISIGIKMHMLKGFNNIQLIANWQLSKDSVPINWYLNFDTPMIALFPLAFYIPLIKTKERFLRMLVITIPWTIATLILVFGLSSYLELALFDPKLPAPSFLWLLVNFFFVVIPEEGFFRGFVQTEVVKALPNKAAPILAILVTSLLFALIHLFSIPSFSFFLCALLTGIMYGSIFQITGSIEASIITHYTLNLTHLFFFSYPLLNTAL